MKRCDMVQNNLEALALNMTGWQSRFKSVLLQFKDHSVLTTETKRAARKAGTTPGR